MRPVRVVRRGAGEGADAVSRGRRAVVRRMAAVICAATGDPGEAAELDTAGELAAVERGEAAGDAGGVDPDAAGDGGVVDAW